MRGSSERDLVRTLERLFGGSAAKRAALVGIGDDAAVLDIGGEYVVWTVDASVAGVHFRAEWLSPYDIGWRSFHAAVSDVAAMAARPVAALSSLVLPPSTSKKAFLGLARGQARAARDLSCPVVGGNLSRGRELSITTSVIGRTKTPVLRSGARPGDELWLLGELGLARAGLLFLSRGTERGKVRRTVEEKLAVSRCIEAWKRPRARIADGLRLRGKAHSAIDVSDGLSTDALRIAEASDVRVVIDASAVRGALPEELVVASRLLRIDPLEIALAGGEDYALLATGPRAHRPSGARRIGDVARGRGLFLRVAKKSRRLSAGGFDHFATR